MDKIKQSILAIVIRLALAAGASFAWRGPTANPPDENAPAPITVQGDNPSTLNNNEGRQEIVGRKRLVMFGYDKEGNLTKDTGVLHLIGGLRVEGKMQIKDSTEGVGKVLVSDEHGIASWGSASGSGSGGFTNFQIFDSPGTFTFTAPSGISKVMVEVWGGGGGASLYFFNRGTWQRGGGGGGYGKGIFNVLSGNQYTVVVGEGGEGGSGTVEGNEGKDGKGSKFSSFITASGGKIGTIDGGGRGGKGAFEAGTIGIDGEDGVNSNPNVGDGVNNALGGMGANGGGRGGCSKRTGGYDGKAPGGGGSCGSGNGAHGRVIVWW